MIRGEERKHQFKKQSDLENGRRRREETSTQIRKAKREEQLMKRRQAPQPIDPNPEKLVKVCTEDDIPKLMSIFTNPGQSDDEVLKALQGFRRMLSVESNPPVNKVLLAGALPYFAQLLNKDDNPTIVFEAAWTLTNIASTDKTKEVVSAGVTKRLVTLLVHQDGQIREQAAWCLGNIAGDSSNLRDKVLQEGALDGLIKNINNPGSMSLLSNVTWALSNLCRGKPSPPTHLVEPAVAPLATLLVRRKVQPAVLVDSVWALSYLSDGDNDRISMVMNEDPDLTSTLVNLLGTSPLELLTPLVRTLGNFVTGNGEQTQAVIDAGVIPYMSSLLKNLNKNLRKEVCWLLSNVAAGTMQQIEAVLKAPGLLELVVDIARDDKWEVRKEALWMVSNIATTGNQYHVRALVQRQGFEVLVHALYNVEDSKMLLVALEAVDEILKVGQDLNLNYTQIFDELNGLDKLEELQEHPSEEIYEKAVAIVEKYFGVEDDDENLAPDENGGMYSFGISVPAKELFPSEPSERSQPFGQSNKALFDFSNGMEH